MSDDLCDLTATELIELYRSAAATPVEVVESCLDRIDAVEPAINAIRWLRADAALADAQASADRWRDGTAGALEGVPYGLKDIIATAGVPTTGGSALYRDLAPDESASHAQRLADAGGILLAKLETFEFACGGPHNRTFGAVHNPWDPERTTGGSSSGSGAAVAARMMPLAVGTDTGGSIRIPSAYCGLTGLKPTYGRVPRHGVMGLSWTLDHVGPMTRSAADAALMLSVMAGHDPRDASSSTRPVPDYHAALDGPLPGSRIGRLRGAFEDSVDAELLARHDEAMETLAGIGFTIVDIELADVDLAIGAAWQILYPEMLSLHEGHFAGIEDRDAMGAAMLAATPFTSAVDYLRGQRYRSMFQAALGEAFEKCAALALPGSCAVPPRLDELETTEQLNGWLASAVMLHIPFNYAGVPALCIPAGLADGMPASLQLVGPPHSDAALLAIAHRFQHVTDHHAIGPRIAATA